MTLANDSPESLQHMIEQCHDYSDRLSVWETQFIESIDDQLRQHGKLSDKQKEILEKIYLKVP
jgi:hypothetical protein